MGIEATLKSVSVELVDHLLGQADVAQIFALRESHDLTIQPLFRDGVPTELKARLAELSSDSMGRQLLRDLRDEQPQRYLEIAPALPLIESAWLEPALDLYKCWGILQYILAAGSRTHESPLAKAIEGGRELAPGLDDPPMTFLDGDEVRAVSLALDAFDFTAAELETRGHAATDVYHWGQPPRDHTHIEPFFRALVEYYREAASADRAMLRWMS